MTLNYKDDGEPYTPPTYYGGEKMGEQRVILVDTCAECPFNEDGEDEYCLGLPWADRMRHPLLELVDVDVENEVHPECPLPTDLIKHKRW